MNLQTIQQLNQLNADFYKSISQEFSDSRNYSWKGWENILPFLKSPLQNVLDIGCGNGRFASFLNKKNFSDYFYTGIDNNSELLRIAKNGLAHLEQMASFIQQDIINTLIDNTFRDLISNQTYDLIVLFGFMHHIPSFELRRKIILELLQLTTPGGILVITFWQFKSDERFLYKQVNPQLLNISGEDLEDNDFILDWQRGKEAFRYFHHTDEEEQKRLLCDLSNFQLEAQFFADGKTNDLNKYLILRKTY